MNDDELNFEEKYKLIITIVKKGLASRVVSSTKKAGVEGGTILLGKGTANKNIYLKFLGIDYDPEKEIILTLVKQEMVDPILEVIIRETQLDKPGKGVGFVINIKELAGICHLLKLNQL